MLDIKYSHLKLRPLKSEYKYILFKDYSQFIKSQELLNINNSDYCSFSFMGEHSIICSNEIEMDAEKTQAGWVALKIVGDMPFGTVQGLIASISYELIKIDVGVCIISTFKTDLFFIKKENLEKSTDRLKVIGWDFLE